MAHPPRSDRAVLSCRDETHQTSPDPRTEPAASAPPSALPPIDVTRPWRIGFVAKTGDPRSAYWQLATEGARRAASEAGIELIVRPPQSETDVDGQQTIVAELVDDDIDAIVLAPTSSQLLAAVVEDAADAGVAIVVLDTPLNSPAVRTFVGVDNLGAAERSGAWVARRIGDGASVALLLGSPGQQNAIERRDGVLLGLRDADISVIGVETAHWDRATAYRISLEWLQRFDELDAIVASNDEMALGALRAADELSRDDLVVTGYDASPAAREAIADGALAATVDQAPGEQGSLAVRAAIGILEGQPVPAVLRLEAPLVTQEAP